MKERDWRTLVHNIQKKNCILVLGPDIAREKGKNSKALTELLSNHLAKEVPKERKVLDPNDLAHTAQLFVEEEGEGNLRLETKSFFDDLTSAPPKVYEDLAAIPFHLVVNAAPDKLLIQALEKAGKTFQADLYNYRGKKRDIVKWDAQDKPLIYYLYGSTDVPESLVISEKHLLSFLVSVISKEPAIQSNIMSEFRHKEKCFLFVGFGFRNWYLRILLYVLLGGKESHSEKASRSFALEEILPENSTDFQHICMLFKENLKIDFSEIAVDEFVAELRRRYDEHAATVQNGEDESAVADVPEEVPKVFICHASEDKKTALELCNELKAGGLNAWIDKEGIRGGDQWDRLLEKTIKESDYFIVLQSEAMAAKTVGYVNKEIHLAIARQQEFRFGIKFIIPVKIDDSDILEELDFIQTVDLTDMNNVSQLLKDIRRDQQRRKSK